MKTKQEILLERLKAWRPPAWVGLLGIGSFVDSNVEKSILEAMDEYASQSEWTPIVVEKPASMLNGVRNYVWLGNADRVVRGNWDDGVSLFFDHKGIKVVITHWQPILLPEPPKC